MIRASLVLTFLLAGCVTSTDKKIEPLSGNWGGQHVGLTLDASGGKLEYDCAAGVIYGPVILDPLGEFHEKGTHTPGTGGPVRQDEVPQALPALYHGSVRGERMTLRVIVPSNGTVIGPFELILGSAPILMRCL